jgi:hypothetical protein
MWRWFAALLHANEHNESCSVIFEKVGYFRVWCVWAGLGPWAEQSRRTCARKPNLGYKRNMAVKFLRRRP